jgi:hypothetical protein
MIKAIELENWASEILPVLTDINISITNLRIIKVEDDKGLHIIRHGFFRNIWFQQRFILFIQLSKLFSKSDNQKRNFVKLCNRLENEPLDKSIKDLLIQNKLKFTSVFRSRKDVLNEIKSIRNRLLQHKNTIDNIILVRDKVCAHTDPTIHLPVIAHDELEAIVLLANEIYNTLFGKIFDRYFDLARTADWDLRYIIKKLPPKLASK